MSGYVLLLELYFVHGWDHTLVASDYKTAIQNAEVFRRAGIVLVVHVQSALKLTEERKLLIKGFACR